jgi:hypothetical protein
MYNDEEVESKCSVIRPDVKPSESTPLIVYSFLEPSESRNADGALTAMRDAAFEQAFSEYAEPDTVYKVT